MIVLFWVLNFIISWANAWGCGKSWNETKHVGGMAHFMNWCGAIMSACGFSWCYGVIAGAVASQVPVHDKAGHVHMLLGPDALMAFADLGYLVLIFPILGTGLAITLGSWSYFWRNRSFGSGATAGWNSFAQVYNMVHALHDVPTAFEGVGKLFKSDNKDSKGVVAALVLACACLGILTTYWILTATARSTARERYFAQAAQRTS